MIPSADELVRGWAFLARRRGISGVAREDRVGEVVELARQCARLSERDEPAALFFALARHPDAFEGGWRAASEAFPVALAHQLGLRLATSPLELANLRVHIYAGRAGWDDVRAWFRARLAPAVGT